MMETGGFEVRGESHDDLTAKAQAVCNTLVGDATYQWRLDVAGEGSDLLGAVTFAQLRPDETAAGEWFVGDPSVRWPTPEDESPRIMTVPGTERRWVPVEEGHCPWADVDLGDRLSPVQQRLAFLVCNLIGHQVEASEDGHQECPRCRRTRTRGPDGWRAWSGRRLSRRQWRRLQREITNRGG